MHARKSLYRAARAATPAQPNYEDEVSSEYIEFQKRKIEEQYPQVRSLIPVGEPGW